MLDNPYPPPRVLVEGRSMACALVRGDSGHPELRGEVLFYPFCRGSLLLVRVAGLPQGGFFGFHIHEHGECCDGGDVAFHHTGGHYGSGGGVTHPHHAGDLPVLLSDSEGVAYAIFYTGRFTPQAVIGRAVIIHEKPDDYRSQPAGDSGMRIACGGIEATS